MCGQGICTCRLRVCWSGGGRGRASGGGGRAGGAQGSTCTSSRPSRPRSSSAGCWERPTGTASWSACRCARTPARARALPMQPCCARHAWQPGHKPAGIAPPPFTTSAQHSHAAAAGGALLHSATWVGAVAGGGSVGPLHWAPCTGGVHAGEQHLEGAPVYPAAALAAA